MVNQAGPPGPFSGAAPEYTPAPPDGYWYGHSSHKNQAQASKDGRTRVAKEFEAQVLKGVETYTQPETDPEKLREAFKRKPVALWVGQRVYFPRMFEAAWTKWERVDPSPEARRLRDAIMAEVSAQADALERQLLLQEAQSRAPQPVMESAPVGPGAAPPPEPPPVPAPMA